jgi:hypothetical protein
MRPKRIFAICWPSPKFSPISTLPCQTSHAPEQENLVGFLVFASGMYRITTLLTPTRFSAHKPDMPNNVLASLSFRPQAALGIICLPMLLSGSP